MLDDASVDGDAVALADERLVELHLPGDAHERLRQDAMPVQESLELSVLAVDARMLGDFLDLPREEEEDRVHLDARAVVIDEPERRTGAEREPLGPLPLGRR